MQTKQWLGVLTFFVAFGSSSGWAADAGAERKTGKTSADAAVRPMKAGECDRNYPDKVACPPKEFPADRRCDVLAQDIAGLSGMTPHSSVVKKTDLRKQFDLTCSASRGSDFECDQLRRDLAGSAGIQGHTAEMRKSDLRWIVERRCTPDGGASRRPSTVIVIER